MWRRNMRDIQKRQRELDNELLQYVIAARFDRVRWQDIAAGMGLTTSAVHKRYKHLIPTEQERFD